jgi:hypothetical protein
MAIMRQGILGGLKNKIGSVVGTSWKGIAVLKSLPLSVANPRTTPQVNQRTKFAAVVAFASAINSILIKPLWDRFAQRKSGNNAFVQANIDFFNSSGVLSTPASLKISEGKMSATPILTATADISGDTVLLTWSATLTDSFQASTDKAYVLVYNITTGEIIADGGGNARTEESISLDVAVNAGNVIHCYLAFRRVDGTVVSDTAYLLATVVA